MSESDKILERMYARLQNQVDVATQIIALLDTIETLDPYVTPHIRTLLEEASLLKVKGEYKIKEGRLAEFDPPSWTPEKQRKHDMK